MQSNLLGIDINNEINTEINISIRNDANNFEDNDNCTDESKFDTNQNNDSETSDKDNEITERGSHTIVLNNNDRNQENTQERRIILNKIRNVPIFSDKYCIVDVTQSNGKNVIAKCNFCHPEKIIRGSVRTTSKFTSHFKVKYNDFSFVNTRIVSRTFSLNICVKEVC